MAAGAPSDGVYRKQKQWAKFEIDKVYFQVKSRALEAPLNA